MHNIREFCKQTVNLWQLEMGREDTFTHRAWHSLIISTPCPLPGQRPYLHILGTLARRAHILSRYSWELYKAKSNVYGKNNRKIIIDIAQGSPWKQTVKARYTCMWIEIQQEISKDHERHCLSGKRRSPKTACVTIVGLQTILLGSSQQWPSNSLCARC